MPEHIADKAGRVINPASEESVAASSTSIGATTATPFDGIEDGTARTGISLWKGLKNYVREAKLGIGAAADAMVAVAANGSIIALLKRVTQGLEDLKTGITLAGGTVTANQGTAAAAGAGWTAKDDGPSVAGVETYTPSADMTTAAAIGPAPTSGQKSKLLEISISSDTAMLFTLQEETSATVRHAFRLPANGAVVRVFRYPSKLATADKRWYGKASAVGNVYITTTVVSEV